MSRCDTYKGIVRLGSCVLFSLVCLLPMAAQAAEKAAGGLTITELRAASGKAYVAEAAGFVPGGLQYIDRDYTFDYIPQVLKGATKIKTAGDDKHIPEDKACLSFRVNVPVTVYVVYGDKLRVVPSWLREWTDTRYKVTRKDTNPSSLKGIFTLFAKDFPAGVVTLNGNLSKRMAEDEEFKRMKGGTFCMYSVVVVPKR
jgi:hypothetical protein